MAKAFHSTTQMLRANVVAERVLLSDTVIPNLKNRARLFMYLESRVVVAATAIPAPAAVDVVVNPLHSRSLAGVLFSYLFDKRPALGHPNS